MSKEKERLQANTQTPIPLWYKWGPYVAERAWGTVREDYSPHGDAWNYFPFDVADSKVFRWGDDAIAGWCDRYQTVIFGPAFWNHKDPILKERLFGLNPFETNHGEDVKEVYFHLDGTPTHSYMKFLYKYPQTPFPYAKLKEESKKRGHFDPEYELIDTGAFEKNRYFDIFIEYAKVDEEDFLVRIEAWNRGEEEAPLDVIPQLWFRNQWGWGDQKLPEPSISLKSQEELWMALEVSDEKMLPPQNLPFEYRLGKRFLYATGGGTPLFTNNEDLSMGENFLKDGFQQKIIHGKESVNPNQIGTKSGIHYRFQIPAGKSKVVYCRITPKELKNPFEKAQAIFDERKREADEFYQEIHPPLATPEEKAIQRQALAGMLWTKQIYLFDVNQWLEGDSSYTSVPGSRHAIRNGGWRHLNSMRVLSMPDKWEYPWFASWDLAFHCLSFALIDIEFAKEQLWLLLFDQFQHPSGQIPAYEWNFSDLNPPIQAWAAWQLYCMEQEKWGKKDFSFLKKCFDKLLINFAWWVNKVDRMGYNVFEGGFLGLDNISLIDRSEKFEEGVRLEQSDGTGWMASFCLCLMRIALELAKRDSTFEGLATKFFQHFVYIAHAMKERDGEACELWDEEDGFFYDILRYDNGDFARFRVRSLVGIIPLFAVDILTEEDLKNHVEFAANFTWFMKNRRKLVVESITKLPGERYLLALVNQNHLMRMMKYIWDPAEFRSEYGLRSLSRYHEKNPFSFKGRNVGYEPAEASSQVKGGNSNWRGPIWFCMNYLFIRSINKFFDGYGKELTIQHDSEAAVDLDQMAKIFATKLINLYTTKENGQRAYRGESFPFHQDPYWKEHLLFYEYFHPDLGKGLGASHQTGWTGLIANLIDEFRK